MSQQEEQARSVLTRLDHVRQDRVEPFLEYCRRRGLNPLGHALRCESFGGSEIGALIRHADKGRPLAPSSSFFSTAEDVVATKQLVRFPFAGSEHTRRGHEVEPVLRYAMHKMFGATPDREGMKAIAVANTSDTKLPFLRISPDDLIFIGSKLYIPDYKMPNDATGDIEDDYGWQLHSYKMAAYEKAGISVDGILLVRGVLPPSVGADLANWLAEGRKQGQRDHANRIAQAANSLFLSGVPGMGLKVEELEYDPAKGERIKKVCREYWNNYVLTGEQPSMAPSEPMDLKPGLLAELRRTQDKLAVVLSAKSVIEDEEKRLKAEAGAILDSAGSPITNDTAFPESLVRPVITKSINWEMLRLEVERRGIDTTDVVTTGSAYNVKALTDELERLGVDLEDVKFREQKIDTKALVKLAEESGIDPTPCITYQPRLGLGRDKATKAKVSEISTDFGELFEEWGAAAIAFNSSDEEVEQGSATSKASTPGMG